MVTTAEEAEVDGETMNTSPFPEQMPEPSPSFPESPFVAMQNGSISLLQLPISPNETEAALTPLF